MVLDESQIVGSLIKPFTIVKSPLYLMENCALACRPSISKEEDNQTVYCKDNTIFLHGCIHRANVVIYNPSPNSYVAHMA